MESNCKKIKKNVHGIQFEVLSFKEQALKSTAEWWVMALRGRNLDEIQIPANRRKLDEVGEE